MVVLRQSNKQRFSVSQFLKDTSVTDNVHNDKRQNQQQKNNGQQRKTRAS